MAANHTTITIDGLTECMKAFQGLEAELRRNANGELRAASKQISAGLTPMLGGSGSPQEAEILAAAGPKSDRYVVLGVPQRKPALSGLKRTPAATAKQLAWAIEHGSEETQFHNPAAGSLVARHRDRMTAYAIPRYQAALAAVMRKFGLI